MKKTITQTLNRAASTLTKEAGDISSVFPSLSGKRPDPLPPRFSTLKHHHIDGKEDAVSESWRRLLSTLKHEIQEIKTEGNKVRHQPLTYHAA